MKKDDDDGVIMRADKYGNVRVWGTCKNWNKLMQLGKQLGLPEEDIIHAYNVALRNATESGEPTDFDSVLEDTKSGLAFHLEIMVAVSEISSEFDMDVREVYKLLTEHLRNGDCMDELRKLGSNDDVHVAQAAAIVTRKWLKLKK